MPGTVKSIDCQMPLVYYNTGCNSDVSHTFNISYKFDTISNLTIFQKIMESVTGHYAGVLQKISLWFCLFPFRFIPGNDDSQVRVL